MPLSFRPATLADLPEWARLRDELYGKLNPAFGEQEIRRIAADASLASFFVFAENEDVPASLLELSLRNIVDGCLSSPVGYIEGLYLRERWQGRRFGKTLVEFAKKWAREHGCTELAVDAELDNLKAQAFFHHAGFQETFRVVEFKMAL